MYYCVVGFCLLKVFAAVRQEWCCEDVNYYDCEDRQSDVDDENFYSHRSARTCWRNCPIDCEKCRSVVY